MDNNSKHIQLVVCVKNNGCDDLQILKLYQLLPDEKAAEESYIRVVDDSGEDYLYPADYFVIAEFSESTKQRLITAIPLAV